MNLIFKYECTLQLYRKINYVDGRWYVNMKTYVVQLYLACFIKLCDMSFLADAIAKIRTDGMLN